MYVYLHIILRYLWTYCNAGLALQASAPVATFNPVRWESSPLSSSSGAGPTKPRNLPKGKCGHTHFYSICLSVYLRISSNIYIMIDLTIFLPIHLSLTLPSKYLSGYTCTLCFFGYYPVPTHHATAGQLHAYTERERERGTDGDKARNCEKNNRCLISQDLFNEILRLHSQSMSMSHSLDYLTVLIFNQWVVKSESCLVTFPSAEKGL